MSVVFALATPPAKSAICVFRVSGAGCLDGLSKLIKKSGYGFGSFHLKSFFGSNGLIDKAGLVVFKGPNSYTGEDSFEVYAHGGLAVMSSFIKAFKGVGFEEAVGGEFTKRAFLNNKISLHEAEAVADLIDAVDEKEVRLVGRSLFGDLSKDIVNLAENIDLLRVRVEAEIDFSDEGNEYFDDGLLNDLMVVKNNVASFVRGCLNKKNHYKKNNILLVGPVNSGKSSVFNRLLGFERAIVSSVPGTTRDIVNGELFYESNSFSVFDSAGLRDTKDAIEGVGIEKTLTEIKSADLVIGVFEFYKKGVVDGFKNLSKKNKFVSVQNKTDINLKEDSLFDCCVSAKTGEGFDDLKKIILNFFSSSVKQDDHNYLIRERHENIFNNVLICLSSACDGLEQNNSLELVAEDLKNARSGFDELVGKKFSDSLLGDIFNSYCIGK
tara:strand:+ start:2079 stop:3392 length:1314 start_codon:yes stop_codon:yes gene_type:complete